jgi:thiamine biosynthesis lipoprotein
MRAVLQTIKTVLGLAMYAAVLTGCARGPQETILAGSTQGTSYSVRAFCEIPRPSLQADVDAVLAEVDAQMSTYNPHSALSAFNGSEPGAWQTVPAELAFVADAAQQLANLSAGAFDVTVGPLVNVWGFGPDGERDSKPSADAVRAARARIGYQYLEVRLTPPALRKLRDVYVDLGAIAQGYTVDRLAELLDRGACHSYMVEVGGEVRTGRAKPDGQAWRIGIEVPDSDAMGEVGKVLSLTAMAVSTSGDYRDFFEADGQRYSHTMDPRSGAPVAHDLASVTVLHRSTMWADGFATLLDVLGPTDGLAFATRHDLAARFVERTPAGFVEHTSPAFAELLARKKEGT